MQSWSNSLQANAAWHSAANWIPVQIPNASNAEIVIGNTLGSAQTINLNQDVNLNSLSFSTSPNSVELTGNLLLFSGINARVNCSVELATISCGIVLSTSLTINVDPGCTLVVNGVISGGSSLDLLTVNGQGTVIFAGNNTYSSQLINNGNLQIGNNSTSGDFGRDWKMIDSSGTSTYAIKRDGSLWVCGSNNDGQLGDGTKYNPGYFKRIGTSFDWVSVSASSGGTFAAGIQQDGSLWTWGLNIFGQLGKGVDDTVDNPSNHVPVKITDPVQTWRSVSCGYNFAAAISATDNTLWTWGANYYGQLGKGTIDADNVDNYKPVKKCNCTWTVVECGITSTVAIRSDGTMWSWGNGDNGELGTGVNGTFSSSVKIGDLTNWSKVSFTAQHALAIQTNGTLWSWGLNTNGQLGNANLNSQYAPVKIGTDTDWENISCGFNHSSAVKTDGSLWTWGDNSFGQLGKGTVDSTNQVDNYIPRQSSSLTKWGSISCGSDTTYSISKTGCLWLWGDNRVNTISYYQKNERNNSATLTQIDNSQDFVQLSSADSYTLAVKNDGTRWGWGINTDGNLGDGTLITRTTPIQLDSLTSWKSIAAGVKFAAGIMTDGSLWSWGDNTYGQLGLGDSAILQRLSPSRVGTDNDWKSVYCSSFGNTYAIRENGTLWACGNAVSGQLGNGGALVSNNYTMTQIGNSILWGGVVAGHYHVLALRTDGTLWSWGDNALGQLGLGISHSTVSAPTQIPNLGAQYRSIYSDGYSCYAIKQDNTLWSWGDNGFGQLGHGDLINRNIPVRIGTDADWASGAAGGLSPGAAAIKTDGTLWCWGNNRYGQLGKGVIDLFSNTANYAPVQVGVNYKLVECGLSFLLAITQDGKIHSCGRSNLGQLGYPSTSDRLSTPYKLGDARILNNGTITISRTDNYYLNDDISGSGTLIKDGNNHLFAVLSKTLNRVVVNSGTVTLNMDRCMDQTFIEVKLGSTCILSNELNVLSGDIEKTGNGTLVFTGSDSSALYYCYYNTISINGSDVVMNGLYYGTGLIISAKDPNIYGAAGTLLIAVRNLGTCSTGTSEYGKIKLSTGSVIGSLNVPILGTGSLVVDTNTAPFVLIDSLQLEYTGSGLLTVVNSGDYSGSITIQEGSGGIRLGDGISPLANFNPTFISNNSTQPIIIPVPAESTLEILSSFSGSGKIMKTGTGILKLSGASTATGILEVSAGQVIFGAGAINNSAIVNNSGLPTIADVPRDETLTLTSDLSGSLDIPILTKSGLGTLNFTGSSMGSFIVTAGTLSVNGSIGSPLVIPSGVTIKGNGTVNNLNMGAGSRLAVGNSPGLLTVTGDLTCGAGSIIDWELVDNNNSNSNRGILYDAINVFGNVSIDAAAELYINVYGSVNFLNSFWSTRRLWNIITAGGTVNREYSLITLSINSVSQGSARAIAGGFFSQSDSSNILIDYIPDPSSGGDPHITTIHGKIYTLENRQKSMTMYDNGELKIETQMLRMPDSYWENIKDSVTEVIDDMTRKSTYMYQTRIGINNAEIVIDNHSLNIITLKGKLDYTLNSYTPDTYQCYGKTILPNDFIAKLLTVKTDKLGLVELIFVKLRDKTIVNDMRLMANPRLFSVYAEGALISRKYAENWGDSFCYKH